MRPFRIKDYRLLTREQKFLQERDFYVSVLTTVHLRRFGDFASTTDEEVHHCIRAFEWLDESGGGRRFKLYSELRATCDARR